MCVCVWVMRNVSGHNNKNNDARNKADSSPLSLSLATQPQYHPVFPLFLSRTLARPLFHTAAAAYWPYSSIAP